MKHLVALLLALGCVHIRAAPVEQGGIEDGSCADPFAVSAAGLALTKINHNRQEGYVLGLHRLSNVHMMKHGEIGVLFYLTLDVVETNCSVLSRKSWKNCEARPLSDTPVYGQCKAAIYISKVHRVVRLYKYSCHIRPVPSSRLWEICPDCHSPMNIDNAEVQKTVNRSLEKYNKEGGQANRFALLKVNRAMYGEGMMKFYSVEYTIQETICPQTTEEPTAEKCPLMDCEFAHKGFCKASYVEVPEGDYEVTCEVFEPEAADTQKRYHLLGGETDHSHNDTHGHNHDHDHAHDADQAHEHDHVHDHTKSHDQHDRTHVHADNSSHHHTHDHETGSSHSHAHPHSHDHGRDHDHVHRHHAKAHEHGDTGIRHHKYKHADGIHTHEHDHELALDHDHKHGHLHEHEHHHHHHDHEHETSAHDEPKGMVILLPSMGKVMRTIPLPDIPVAGPEMGVTLPLKEDPQIPGEMEPTIEAYPTSLSAQCAAPELGVTLVEQLFIEDPMFKAAA